jgi:glycosyltransferase involved in cell wall biosynthesis
MSGPRITALINTYNYGRFVGEAIESVLAQDVPPGEMEVLVVDDGSTDDTAAQVARFGERVRYVRKENGGQASALNVGFAEARGEIVIMLDGDDLWLPGKLRRVVEAFERNPEAVMVYHPYRVWNMEQNAYWDDAGFKAITGYIPKRVEDVLRYGSFGTCGMALRRDALRQVLPIPEDLRIYADTFLVLVMIFLGPVAAINECLTIYRHHGGNSTAFRAGSEDRLRRRWQHYKRGVDEARAWLTRNGFDVKTPAAAAYFKRHELTAEMFRFNAEGASRAELYRYLRREMRLFRPLWAPRYRFYRTLLAMAAYAAGYEKYMAWRAAYRETQSLQSLRRLLFPHQTRAAEAKQA